MRSIVTYDGMFRASMDQWKDGDMTKSFGMKDHLMAHSYGEDGTSMQVYGDLAYGVNWHLISPF